MTDQYHYSLEPEVLLRQARVGDPHALGQLLQRYRNYLRLLTRLRLEAPLQIKLDGSDLIQETCVKAVECFGQFRGETEAELLAWLRQILARTLANVIRHYSRKRRDLRIEERLVNALNASSQALGHMPIDQTDSPSECASRREQVVLLSDALESLPAHYREVLVLRHLKNQSFPQIAEAMGRSVGSVEKLWLRALARLRDQIGESS